MLRSDAFWNRFIKKVKDSPKTEQSQWDFKQTLNMWHLSQDNKKDEAELKFAELVAGFANANVGVVIIGVTNTPPRKLVGVGDDLVALEGRQKYTRDVIAKYIQYPRDIVHFQLVNVVDENETRKICLLLVIARTSETVAVKDNQGRFTYPVRFETGLSRVDSSQILTKKLVLKSDSFDFIQSFNQMLYDK